MLLAQMSQSERIISLIPFVAYLLAVFVIAIISARYLKDRKFETEYYVGSRSFGPWVLAMSWVATMASGGSFLGYPSLVYTYRSTRTYPPAPVSSLWRPVYSWLLYCSPQARVLYGRACDRLLFPYA